MTHGLAALSPFLHRERHQISLKENLCQVQRMECRGPQKQLRIQVLCCWFLPLLQSELKVKQQSCCDRTAPTCSYLKRGRFQFPLAFCGDSRCNFGLAELSAARAPTAQLRHRVPAYVLSLKLDLTREELSYVLSL